MIPPYIIMRKNAFQCAYKRIVNVTYYIFCWEYDTVNFNNIANPSIIKGVRALIDGQTDGRQANRIHKKKIQLYLKVLESILRFS